MEISRDSPGTERERWATLNLSLPSRPSEEVSGRASELSPSDSFSIKTPKPLEDHAVLSLERGRLGRRCWVCLPQALVACPQPLPVQSDKAHFFLLLFFT